MAWRAANSLIALRAQLQATFPRAKPPATDVNSWGLYGDPEHDPSSDHTPHNFPGWGNEIVTAHDFPHAPSLGLDAGAVTEQLRLSRDSRIKYVIFNKRMFSSYVSNGVPAWTWRTYVGKDIHDTHAHASVLGNPASDDGRLWRLVAPSQGVVMSLSAQQEEWLAWNNSYLDALTHLRPKTDPQSARPDEPVPFVGKFNELYTMATQIKSTVEAFDATPLPVLDYNKLAYALLYAMANPLEAP